MRPIFRFFPLILALVLLATQSFSQITSDFASNDEGWTTPNDADGTIGYSASGGNPAGFVFGTPFSFVGGSGTIYFYFYFIAPGKFTGNRSGYYNGTLRFDLQQSSTNTPTQHAEVIIRNPTTALYYYPATPFQPPAAPTWTTFSVTMNEVAGFWKTTDAATGQAATAAEITAVLTSLTSLEIRGLFRDANTTNRLDNVTLMPPIVVTTQPSPVTLCEGGTATLTTAATGNANILYRWQRETSPSVWTDVTNTGGYSGAATGTLSINTTGNFGAGQYRCRISGTAVNDQFTSAVEVKVNALPAAPSVTPASACGSSALTVSASGGSAGQYRWYTVAVAGTPIAGQTGNTYTTPVLSGTTTYYVAINNGTCQSARTPVVATINTTPAGPTANGASVCSGATATVSAGGGAAGQYRWYTVATGGTPISGQTAADYTTPSLSATTTYYVSINDGTCESARTSVVATVNALPAAPAVTGNSSCGTASIDLTASGGSQGQYRWYADASGGTPISGQTAAIYTTPPLSATTTYYVSINDGTCESARTPVVATVKTIPSAPAATGNSSCLPASIDLRASGGSQGQYRWYATSTGGTAIAGEANDSFSTPVLSVTTSYYVSINDGSCESSRTEAVATIDPSGCNNEPPVITATPLVTQIEGSITVSLTDLLSDADQNLDLATLSIVSPPSSGATAIIDANLNLVIDYKGRPFSGTETIVLQVCDSFSACVQQTFSIEVVGEIVVYNAISSNGDDRNPILFLEYIDNLSDTRENHVTIFNRWGDVVWEGTNYNNTATVFRGESNNGDTLPSGIYFYQIEFKSGRPRQAGYVAVKR